MVALCFFSAKKSEKSEANLGIPFLKKMGILLIFENTLTSDMPDCNSNSLRSARTCAAKQRKLHLQKNFCLYQSGHKTVCSWGKIAVLALGKEYWTVQPLGFVFSNICEFCLKIWCVHLLKPTKRRWKDSRSELPVHLKPRCWVSVIHHSDPYSCTEVPKEKSSFHQAAQILRAKLSEHVSPKFWILVSSIYKPYRKGHWAPAPSEQPTLALEQVDLKASSCFKRGWGRVQQSLQAYSNTFTNLKTKMEGEDPFDRWLFRGKFIPKGWLMTTWIFKKLHSINEVWISVVLQSSTFGEPKRLRYGASQTCRIPVGIFLISDTSWPQLFLDAKTFSKFTEFWCFKIRDLSPWRCCNLTWSVFLTWDAFCCWRFLKVMYLFMFSWFFGFMCFLNLIMWMIF